MMGTCSYTVGTMHEVSPIHKSLYDGTCVPSNYTESSQINVTKGSLSQFRITQHKRVNVSSHSWESWAMFTNSALSGSQFRWKMGGLNLYYLSNSNLETTMAQWSKKIVSNSLLTNGWSVNKPKNDKKEWWQQPTFTVAPDILLVNKHLRREPWLWCLYNNPNKIWHVRVQTAGT